MTTSSEELALPIAEPTLAVLGGDSPSARIKRAFLATRPKFLTASILPVIVGTGWGSRHSGDFDWIAFLLALLATALVHASSNVWNDVGDDILGSDEINEGRIHPFTGGSRFIQNGVLSKEEMLRLSLGLAGVAVALGTVLLWLKGPLILGFGVTGVALGYLYSNPFTRLSSRGVGEVAIGVAFGVLPVCGAAWLQGATIDWATVMLAIPVSCWVMDILIMNEVPDIAADSATGKRTLVVRLGKNATAVLYAVLQLIALAAVAALVIGGRLPILVLIASIGLAIAGVFASRQIGSDDRVSLTRGIKMTLAIHGFGCLWLAAWSLFAIV